MGVKLVVKWVVVFAVLSIWTFFVIQGLFTKVSVSYSVTTGTQATFLTGLALFSQDFNAPIYIETPAGNQKASLTSIIRILFERDFEIINKSEPVSITSCSVRATGGDLMLDGESFGGSNKVSFNINYLANGKGSLTNQNGKNRVSMSFTPKKILETNEDILSFNASGKGRINRDSISLDEVIVEFNKNDREIFISSNRFEANLVGVTFTEGCFSENKEFFLIKDNGKLASKRTISEVRDLIDNHPELTNAYEGLKRLFTDYWWLIVPGGSIS